MGRVRMQIVDDDFLAYRCDALDRLGAKTVAVKDEDAIADGKSFQGFERAVADVEWVLRRDVDRDVPRLHHLIFVHLASYYAPDPGAHRLALDRKRQQPVLGPHAGYGHF